MCDWVWVWVWQPVGSWPRLGSSHNTTGAERAHERGPAQGPMTHAAERVCPGMLRSKGAGISTACACSQAVEGSAAAWRTVRQREAADCVAKRCGCCCCCCPCWC